MLDNTIKCALGIVLGLIIVVNFLKKKEGKKIQKEEISFHSDVFFMRDEKKPLYNGQEYFDKDKPVDDVGIKTKRSQFPKEPEGEIQLERVRRIDLKNEIIGNEAVEERQSLWFNVNKIY